VILGKAVMRVLSQYQASLERLKQTITSCRASIWNNPGDKTKFWHIAYHAPFYTHLYLQGSESKFTPWIKHRDEYQFCIAQASEPGFHFGPVVADWRPNSPRFAGAPKRGSVATPEGIETPAFGSRPPAFRSARSAASSSCRTHCTKTNPSANQLWVTV
jgi:hypothetical protein